MSETTLKIIFSLGFVAGCVVRAACLARIPRWWRDKRTVAADHETSSDRLLLGVAAMGMLVFPLLYLITSWLDFADYRLPAAARTAAGIVGAGAFAGALWLLWRSHVDLGGNFSPELKIGEEHSLVTRGVYRHVRHPMYAAHWLWAVAQALLLQNWLAGPAMLAAFLPLYLLRVPNEERMMLERFGEEYRSYIGRTGRIIPRLRR